MRSAAIIVLGGACISAVLFAHTPTMDVLTVRVWSGLVVGCLVVWSTAGLLMLTQARESSPPPVSMNMPPLRPLPFALGGAMLAVVSLASTAVGRVHWPRYLPPDLQFGLLLGGIALVIVGGGGVGRVGRGSLRLPTPLPMLALAGITVLAFGLRAYNLGAVRRFVDEWHFLTPTLNTLGGLRYGLLEPLNIVASFPGVYAYLHAWSMRAFGYTFTGMRFVSVVFGTLTVPATYWLAREVFDWRAERGRGSLYSPAPLQHPTLIAVVAALILATYPPHIHFSRTALNNIADPLFGVLIIALILFAVRTGGGRALVWAGACLALTHYFYEGGKLVFTGVFLVAPLWARLSLRAWVRTAFVALVIAAPVQIALTADALSPAPRLVDQTTRDTIAPENALLPVLHLVHLPDDSREYYGGRTALVLPPLVPLLEIGFGVVLWMALARRRRVLAPLLVIGFALAGNALLTEPVWTARYVLIFPMLGLLMACALCLVPWRWVVLGLALIIGAGQAVYYYGVHLPGYQLDARTSLDEQDVIFRLQTLPPGVQPVLITETRVFEGVLRDLARFLQIPYTLTVVDAATVRLGQPGDLPPGHVYFIDPEDAALNYLLQTRYGGLVSLLFTDDIPREKQYGMFITP